MSLFSKKLPNRFIQEAYIQMGNISNKPRTNSYEELVNSINAYAKENPEIAEFAKQIKDMNPKHLGLAHDIIDLSGIREMLPTNIDLNKPTNAGKSIAGYILSKLPEVSKKNPAALELTESVINNSDTQNAKYFLSNLFGFDLTKMSNLSEQMKATTELVPNIAKSTLDGMYTMDFSKNENFFKIIQRFCSGDTKPENLKLLKKITDISDEVSDIEAGIDIDDIRLGNTDTIKTNLEILPSLLEKAKAQGCKTLDVSGFLTKNTNLD